MSQSADVDDDLFGPPEPPPVPRAPGDMREFAETLTKKAKPRVNPPAARPEPAPEPSPPPVATTAPAPAETPPAPPEARPPATGSEISAAVAEAQQQLAAAGGAGAFARDPYRMVLAAQSVTLGTFPVLVRSIETTVGGVAEELGKLAHAVRHPMTDTERATLRRDVVEAARAGGTEGMTAAAAQIAAAARATDRATDRRTLGIALAGAMVALAAVGIGGVYYGRSGALTEAAALRAAERADLVLAQESITLSVADARAWAQLIRANPSVRENLARTQNRQTDAGGQPSGLVPLWLEPRRVPTAGR